MKADATTLPTPIHRRKRRTELKIVPELATDGKWRVTTPQAASRAAKKSPDRVRWRITFYEAGRRRRLFFGTEAEAKGKLNELQVRRENLGTRATNISGRIAEDAAEAARMLEPLGVSILDVARDYVSRREAADRSVTISALKDEFIESRTAKGKSGYYLRDLKGRLGKFAEEFSDRLACEISAKEVDDWATALPVGALTVGNYLRVVAAMFGFAVKRGYCDDNPAAAVDKPDFDSTPPAIFEPAVVAKLLKKAASKAVPYLAIGFFAGLRPEEIKRLDWRQIDFEAGVIEVTAKNSKTARRRLVEMKPNLRAWLKKHQGVAGAVTPPNMRKLRLAAMKAACVDEWPVDVMRHSFCSYHLADGKNAEATALQAGHGTTKMIFEHYRELVKPAAARCYWRIAPPRKRV